MEVTMEDHGATEVPQLAPQLNVEETVYDKLQESRTSVEEIVAKMLSIKNEGKPKSELREHVMQMLLNFVALRQRKELSKIHEKLGQQKKSLLEIIANRKKFLSSLPSNLKSLKKASSPVQNQLGVVHTKKLKQHHSAELLPPPLYVIYSQFIAQKEAFGENIDMEIIGSVKDAQANAHRQAN